MTTVTLADLLESTQPIGYTGSQGITGFDGSRGDTGFTGSHGATGNVGFSGSRGISGYTGSIGYTGSFGNTGYTGSRGDKGFAGSVGNTGNTGFTGSRGNVGFTGSQGIPGAAADKGYDGSRGDLGYSGSVGFTGSQGIAGEYAALGYAGSQGDVGYTGSQGVVGYAGSQGDVGYAGSQGDVGFTGSQGIPGEAADKGYDGSRGDVGYTGSIGPVGFTGSRGIAGEYAGVGYTGSQGEPGNEGPPGIEGYTGSQGTTGYAGSQGSLGYTGSQGLDGGINFQYAYVNDGIDNEPGSGNIKPVSNLTTYSLNFSGPDDGNPDWLVINNPLTLQTSDFTVEGWFRPAVQYSTSSGAFLISGEYTGSDIGWSIAFNSWSGSGGLAFLYGRYGDFSVAKYVSGYFGTADQWDHIVWQRRNGVLECYINGVSQTLTAVDDGAISFNDAYNLDSTQSIYRTFGGDPVRSSFYTGYVSNFRIVKGSYVYNGNFTSPSTELTAIANTQILFAKGNSLVDSGPNNISITLNNAGTPTQGNITVEQFSPFIAAPVLTSVGNINISKQIAGGANIASYLETLDNSTSNIKGQLLLTNKSNSTQFVLYNFDNLTFQSNYVQANVIYQAGTVSSFTSNQQIAISFQQTGDRGLLGYAGSQGTTGYAGSQGTTGYTGSQGTQGATGFAGSQGETGLGFAIAKSYGNVAALTADTSPTGITSGQFAIVETGDVNDPENSRLYLWNGSTYSYVSDLSGAIGITGPAGSTGFTGSVGVGYAGSQGDQGEQGLVGYSGSQGEQGVVGYAGSQGTAGYAGSQGDLGYTGSAGTLTNWSVKTANYTAIAGDRIIAKTTSGPFTVTLPATPSTGNYVVITDGYSFLSNSLFVAANGSTIESASNDIEIDIAQITVEFFYDGATWQIISTSGPSGFVGSAGAPGGGGFATYTISANTTAQANSRYIVNTNTSNVTVTLPEFPILGDQVSIIDGSGNASIHTITVSRNGNKIMGVTEDMTVSSNRAGFTLVFFDIDNGWVLADV